MSDPKSIEQALEILLTIVTDMQDNLAKDLENMAADNPSPVLSSPPFALTLAITPISDPVLTPALAPAPAPGPTLAPAPALAPATTHFCILVGRHTGVTPWPLVHCRFFFL